MFHYIKELETGEMAEQLGATIALSEDLLGFQHLCRVAHLYI